MAKERKKERKSYFDNRYYIFHSVISLHSHFPFSKENWFLPWPLLPYIQKAPTFFFLICTSLTLLYTFTGHNYLQSHHHVLFGPQCFVLFNWIIADIYKPEVTKIINIDFYKVIRSSNTTLIVPSMQWKGSCAEAVPLKAFFPRAAPSHRSLLLTTCLLHSFVSLADPPGVWVFNPSTTSFYFSP